MHRSVLDGAGDEIGADAILTPTATVSISPRPCRAVAHAPLPPNK